MWEDATVTDPQGGRQPSVLESTVANPAGDLRRPHNAVAFSDSFLVFRAVFLLFQFL